MKICGGEEMSEKAKKAMETIVANVNRMTDFDLGYTLGRLESMAEQNEAKKTGKEDQKWTETR